MVMELWRKKGKLLRMYMVERICVWQRVLEIKYGEKWVLNDKLERRQHRVYLWNFHFYI
jgi:hypothetical protein